MFSQACVNNSVHGGGGCIPAFLWAITGHMTSSQADTLSGQTHPLRQTPPRQIPPRQTPPFGYYGIRSTSGRYTSYGMHSCLVCSQKRPISCTIELLHIYTTEQSRLEDAVRKYSLPLKIEVLSVANIANTKPLDVVGDEWLITDTYEDLFLKINHINEDGNYFLLEY